MKTFSRMLLGLAMLGAFHATANACTPVQGVPRPTLEDRYRKAQVVALVRVKEKFFEPTSGTSGAVVEILESFKGPATFSKIFTSTSTCGIPFWVNDEMIVFLDAKFWGYTFDTIKNMEGGMNAISLASPELRRLNVEK